MVAHQRRSGSQSRVPSNEVSPNVGVTPHDFPLVLTQWSGLVEDVVSDADHAEIVQFACHAYEFDISTAQIELLRQQRGEFCHTSTVACDRQVTGVKSLGRKFDGCFTHGL